MKERVLRLFRQVGKPLDAIALINGVEPHLDRTFFYATGLGAGLFEGCVAVLRPDGSLTVVSSRLESDIAGAAGVPVEVFSTKEERQTILRGLLADAHTLGFNGKEITYSGYRDLQGACPDATLEDVSEAVVRARQVKDQKEIGTLRRACTIGVEAFEELLPYVEVGRSEAEIAAELAYLMQGKGASGPSFATIAASGHNSALPHHSTGDRRLQDGDLLLLDFGALYLGYASDITRTVVLGQADKKQKRIHQVVLDAQEAALAAMKAGADGREVYETARRVIDATEFKDKFTHGLGHTIGLAVHDGAAMRGSESLTLESGMAMTVEPGIYLLGYGGVRIEDDVLITDNGVEVLTSATRELLEI